MLSLKVLTNKVLFIKVIKKTVFIGFNNLWLQLILIFIVRNTFYAFLKKKIFELYLTLNMFWLYQS